MYVVHVCMLKMLCVYVVYVCYVCVLWNTCRLCYVCRLWMCVFHVMCLCSSVASDVWASCTCAAIVCVFVSMCVLFVLTRYCDLSLSLLRFLVAVRVL